MCSAPANENRPIRLSLAQVAGVAVAAVALWQFVASPLLPTTPGDFTPASASTSTATLQVIFAGSASMADITATLGEVNGVLIDGPSAIGLYRIGFLSDAARDAARDILLSRPDLIQEALAE